MKKITRLPLTLALALLPLTLQAVPAESLREAVQRAVVSNPEVQARWHALPRCRKSRMWRAVAYYPRVDLTAGVGP